MIKVLLLGIMVKMLDFEISSGCVIKINELNCQDGAGVERREFIELQQYRCRNLQGYKVIILELHHPSGAMRLSFKATLHNVPRPLPQYVLIGNFFFEVQSCVSGMLYVFILF